MLHLINSLNRFQVLFCVLVLSLACKPPDPVEIGEPLLSVENPFDLGESPKGISLRRTMILKNTGDAPCALPTSI